MLNNLQKPGRTKVTKEMLVRFQGKSTAVAAALELDLPYRTYTAYVKGLRPIPDVVYGALKAARAERKNKRLTKAKINSRH